MFRRKPDDDVTDSSPQEESSVATVAGARTKSYTPSKKELGKITPKRKAGGRVVEAPPANRREAMKRARLKQRESRAEQRAGMMAGKEEYLLNRDKGPERRLVRDIVDARRNLASYLLPAVFIVFIAGYGSMPGQVRLYANILWFAFAFAVVVDSVLLSRRIKKLLTERFPRSDVRPRSVYLYAIMRSLSFRRMRMPAPQVKPGTKI